MLVLRLPIAYLMAARLAIESGPRDGGLGALAAALILLMLGSCGVDWWSPSLDLSEVPELSSGV